MFDFFFGGETEIKNHDEDFLIFTKRMLPRWINQRVENDFAMLMGDDIFFEYFAIDQSSMKKKGMTEKSQDRFVSFQIQK